ncbi:MAG: rhomboid family intramembrane serine protease [Bdellovibrionaceae bacterium]|nr:rhomboid family intramembrane serine protease [Pseudobdellovibrionaceae bacterium]
MLPLRIGLQSRIIKIPTASLILMALMAVHSVLTHQNLFLLFGNLLVFAVFAFFLEQRLGPIGMVALFVAGYFGANLAQSPFLRTPSYLIGPNGAVCACIGAFAIYFWNEKMCISKYTVPSWGYLGGFFVMAFLMSPTPIGALAGAMGGAIFALLQMEIFPLKKTFLFRQEQKLYYQAKETENLDEKLAIFAEIHRLNKESFYSFRALFLYFCRQGFQIKNFHKNDRIFIANILTSCFNHLEKNSKYDLTQEIISMTPLSWSLAKLKLKAPPQNIIDRAQYFRKLNDYVQTLRLYDLFMDKFAAHPKAQEVQADIMKIFDHIEKFPSERKAQTLDMLLVYTDSHPDNHFQTQLKQLIHQVHREEKNAIG